MSLPAQVSDAEFSRVVHDVAQLLWKKFGRVHGTVDDFAQMVALWSLESMPGYDPSRPLPNFLFTNARNRAMNAVRDKVKRYDPPCRACHDGRPCGPNGTLCPRYAGWSERNRAKANLCRPASLDTSAEGATGSASVENEVVGRELATQMEAWLPPKLRADFLKILDGNGSEVRVTRRARIQNEIAALLGRPELVTLKLKTASKAEMAK